MISASERFWQKVSKTETCWLWQAGKTSRGYGVFSDVRRKLVYAHRWAYTHINGVIPSGLELDHLCRNPSCVNPDHLEAVTHFENIRRGDAAKDWGKTHCRKGHLYNLLNTFWQGPNDRVCRTCKRERERVNSKRYYWTKRRSQWLEAEP